MPAPTSPRARRPARGAAPGTAAALVTAAVLAVTTTACTSDDAGRQDATTAATTSSATASFTTALSTTASSTTAPSITAPSITATSSAPAPNNTAAPFPTADPGSLPGPYIAGVRWVETDQGASLQITPTPAGRRTAGPEDGRRAWDEVVVRTPRADSPGMWEQFDCHWTFARLLQPDKPTWNLEPWRPVVPQGEMLADRCNPGGPEI